MSEFGITPFAYALVAVAIGLAMIARSEVVGRIRGRRSILFSWWHLFDHYRIPVIHRDAVRLIPRRAIARRAAPQPLPPAQVPRPAPL